MDCIFYDYKFYFYTDLPIFRLAIVSWINYSAPPVMLFWVICNIINVNYKCKSSGELVCSLVFICLYCSSGLQDCVFSLALYLNFPFALSSMHVAFAKKKKIYNE